MIREKNISVYTGFFIFFIQLISLCSLGALLSYSPHDSTWWHYDSAYPYTCNLFGKFGASWAALLIHVFDIFSFFYPF